MSDRVTKSTSHTRNFFPLEGVRKLLQRQILLELHGFWPLASVLPSETFFLVRRYLGYNSPFACRVARRLDLEPAAIAERVAAYLAMERGVRAKPNGWLEFDLLPSELVHWLADARAKTSSAGVPVGVAALPIGASLGLHQYAHARCCQWLVLGRETNLLTTEAIAWERLLAATPPSQAELLGVLIDLGDRAAAASGEAAATAFEETDALQLAAAVLAFQQDCPLWGECCRRERTLAQARLELIGIARGVLAWLLEICLERPAPQNL